MSMATPANMLITSLFAISLPLYTVYHAVSRTSPPAPPPFLALSLALVLVIVLEVVGLVRWDEQDEADRGCRISTSLINSDV